MQLEFDLQVTGETPPEPSWGAAEVEQLFQAARSDLSAVIERKLAGVRCFEHDASPLVRVTISYDQAAEQMDVSYNVEACCQPFLLRVVQLLHRIG
jgi:hypothetical protein